MVTAPGFFFYPLIITAIQTATHIIISAIPNRCHVQYSLLLLLISYISFSVKKFSAWFKFTPYSFASFRSAIQSSRVRLVLVLFMV